MRKSKRISKGWIYTVSLVFLIGMETIALPGTEPAIAQVTETAISFTDDEEDEEWEIDIDDDVICGYPVQYSDIAIFPSKKTVHKGKSFFIQLGLSEELRLSGEYDFLDEEVKEMLNESIDSISYRSSRVSVASVNKKGKVKGKKKGSAIIKTTVGFKDGSESTYKTKVYVTK